MGIIKKTYKPKAENIKKLLTYLKSNNGYINKHENKKHI
jgi:hypothetical protein